MAQPIRNVLPYQVEDYKVFYSDEYITEFQHAPLAKGATDPKDALRIVEQLNQFAQKEVKNIRFNPEMITGNQLIGGACSVVSLRVAKSVLEIVEHLAARKGMSEEDKEKILINKIRQCVEEINLEAASNKKNYEERRKEMRTLQQAFNAITVDRKVETADVVQDKINALASYFQLQVSESTPQIQGDETLEENLHKQMKQLSCGVYLMRIIDYKYNHKLEEKGHSVVYVKTPHSELYFDPALGLYMLFKQIEKVNLIYDALLSAKLKFQVDQLSFHKLEKVSKQKEERFGPSDSDGLASINYETAAQAFDVQKTSN